jgi:hypothetical protein
MEKGNLEALNNYTDTLQYSFYGKAMILLSESYYLKTIEKGVVEASYNYANAF